jgi:protocatechuate 3,4-dioxygenase beta subunit
VRLALFAVGLPVALAAVAGCGGSDPPASKPAATEAKAAGCTPTQGQPEQGEPVAAGAPSKIRLGPGMELERNAKTLAAGRVGKPLLVRGSVRSEDCAPLEGASVHVWQTNGDGRYGPGDGERLRCCWLQGTARTDAQGRVELRAVRPGSYGGQPAHIHMVVGHPEADGVGMELTFEDGDSDPVEEFDVVLRRR